MPTMLQWVKHLLAKIEEQTAYAAPFEKRYTNQHVMPFLATEYREVYGTRVDGISWPGTLEPPKSGTAAIVVDGYTDRLTLRGWAVEDEELQKRLNEAWEDSALDVTHREGHREWQIGGRSFVSAHRSEGDSNRAVVAVDTAQQMAVHRRPGPPYEVDAAFKVWTDEWTGKRSGLLQVPGYDIPVTERDAAYPDPEMPSEWHRWTWDPDMVRPTGMQQVMVAELAPRRRLLQEPVSEIDLIASNIDVLDLVDGLMVFAGHFGAVPIRYIEGLDVPRDPKDPTKPLLGPDGKPMIGFNPRADHTWVAGPIRDKDGKVVGQPKFGQLTPAGLASFVTWGEFAAGRVRSKTALASTYFSLDLKSHMSAELLKVDEAPMMRRVRSVGMEGSLNAEWRRVGRWVLDIERPGHNQRPAAAWADPETRIETQQVDNILKLVSSGMGIETVATEMLDWPPEKVKEAVAEDEARRAAEADPMMDRLLKGGLGVYTNAGA